jgi:succinoglycan biosynthesis transport protein ExoP
MKQEYERINQDMDQQMMIREPREHYLPSTEVREVVPEFKDEIDLKDLLDTLIRRKSIVLACLLLCFSLVAIYTFTVTPMFKAKGVLRVSSQSNNLTKFENIETSALKTMEFQQTQVKLMQSEQLASRVIDRMDLTNDTIFTGSSGTSSGEAQAKGLFDTIKSFIRPDENSDTFNMLPEDAQNQIIVDQALGKFSKQFSVSPIRNSELIDISFIASSPVLSAEVANTAMDEFINMLMDTKLKSSQNASKFLQKQIESAQIKLEESEMGLQAFARKIGIVSLNPKLNLTMRQLEELNDALAKARTHRIAQEAKYQQTVLSDSVNLNQMVENELIQNLKNQHATLLSEYQEMGKTFKPAYPKMQQLKARMDKVEERMLAEQAAIIDSVKNDYETALKTEEYLATRTEEHKLGELYIE